MKSYTDIEQSKKLAEILPLESADMIYNPIMDIDTMSNVRFLNTPECYPFDEYSKYCSIKPLPCWSLVALLGVINKDYYTALYHDGAAWNFDVTHHDNETDKHNTFADTPVDACVEMINKLHKLNSL